MSFHLPRHIHLIGVGGINMSGLAKLLVRAGVRISASDIVSSDITDELTKKKFNIKIGHAAEHVPADTELVVYSSAVPESNPERAEARRRGLMQLNNFEFLSQWFADQDVFLITGTHGKSTTTALTGLMFAEAGVDPTVVVGSSLSLFPDGNVRIGQGRTIVIEGDEYAKHFLYFQPQALIINNIEWDHPDAFPTLNDLMRAFRELLKNVRDGGVIIANADDPHVGTLIGEERSRLEARGIRIRTFGFASHADMQIIDHTVRPGEQVFTLRDEHELAGRYLLHVPGRMNVLNATAAISLVSLFGTSNESIRHVLGLFQGIWRRFEKVAEQDGITVISDYAHHPTAIAATLEAARQWYPGRRIVLCFQPHQRVRTKELFLDFAPSFDRADVLLLTEIYDVAGREDTAEDSVSSLDLVQTITHHDADRVVKRPVEYATNSEEALVTLRRVRSKGDVMIIMGAGDIYQIAKRIL